MFHELLSTVTCFYFPIVRFQTSVRSKVIIKKINSFITFFSCNNIPYFYFLSLEVIVLIRLTSDAVVKFIFPFIIITLMCVFLFHVSYRTIYSSNLNLFSCIDPTTAIKSKKGKKVNNFKKHVG